MENYKTKTREYILDFMIEHKKKSFTVKEMYNEIKLSGNSINLTTIYRNVDKMVEAGLLIKHMDASKNEASYQYLEDPVNCVRHLHMECKKCGRVIHLDSYTTNSFIRSVSLNSQFMIDCKDTVVYGLCNSCHGKFLNI